jgi:hypothetical protein
MPLKILYRRWRGGLGPHSPKRGVKFLSHSFGIRFSNQILGQVLAILAYRGVALNSYCYTNEVVKTEV